MSHPTKPIEEISLIRVQYVAVNIVILHFWNCFPFAKDNCQIWLNYWYASICNPPPHTICTSPCSVLCATSVDEWHLTSQGSSQSSSLSQLFKKQSNQGRVNSKLVKMTELSLMLYKNELIKLNEIRVHINTLALEINAKIIHRIQLFEINL